MVSMPFSHKNFTEGHTLRHVIYEKYKHSGMIDFYGSGVPNNTLDFNDCFKDYKYTIAIENCLQAGYNSEKLYDAFLTGCIPLYWGSKLENKNFDLSSLFYFSPDKEKVDFNFDESLNNFESILKLIYNTDPYYNLTSSILNNYKYMVDNKQTEDNLFNVLNRRLLI
jgi:hypothetical protein